MQKWAENSENFGSVPDALADIRDRMHYVALLNVHHVCTEPALDQRPQSTEAVQRLRRKMWFGLKMRSEQRLKKRYVILVISAQFGVILRKIIFCTTSFARWPP